jgi:sugar phosphate isomerase/epimerase
MKDEVRSRSPVTGHRSRPFSERLALHHWTLDHLPLADFLRVARAAGWNGVELRRSSFTKCYDAGMSNAQVVDLIRASGIAVATLGTEYGLFFAKGEERERLLKVLDETCANAAALGCGTIMCAEGRREGTLSEVADNLRAGGEVCRRYNVRLAFEFSSTAAIVNSLAVARDVQARVNHPSVGLLLDAYHLHRTGGGGRGFAEVPTHEIFAFQYSDVPPTPLVPGAPPNDRLVPGKGVVRWREVFQLLEEKGYPGYISYECPNPANQSRPPQDVAREGLEATRALLG